mgnify:CR=1 FL=1
MRRSAAIAKGILAISCILAFSATVAWASPGNAGKPQTTDIASSGLVGHWLVLGLDGKACIEFRADGTGVIRQADEEYQFSYTVNDSVTPHWIDLVSEGDTVKTIYELADRETLRIVDDVTDGRPREFGDEPLLLSRALDIPVEEAPTDTFLGRYDALGDSRYSAMEFRADGTGLVFGMDYPEEGLAVAWKRDGAFLEVTMGDIDIRFRLMDGRTLRGPSDGTSNMGRIFYRKDQAGQP